MLILQGSFLILIFTTGILLSWSWRNKLMIHQQKQSLAQQENTLAQKNEEILLLRERVTQLQTHLESEQTHTEQKLALLLNAKEQMHAEFNQLAQKILDEKGAKFTQQNQSQLQQLLSPLREQLNDFSKKIHDQSLHDAKERGSLLHEIKHLAALNQQISQDAVNLTNALRGQSKTQGIWGEFILASILEKSGLQKGSEYQVQVSLRDKQGKLFQPDVIVYLPDHRTVIIDAKVSLTAYERYCQASELSDQSAAKEEHIRSLRQHIKTLSAKQYQTLPELNTLDFVLMFLPIEPALSLGLQHEPALFSEALSKNIILVTPTTLLATLRTIENLWQFERQNKNALQIAEHAGLLYDKLVGFVDDLNKLGEHIDKAQKTFDSTLHKLKDGKGNVFNKIEHLKKLGAKTSKQLSEVDTTP